MQEASKNPTVPRHKHRFWRLLRIYFRRFRITVWVCILLFLASVIYVNQIGLPGFVKKPLLEKLRARGLDLQFSRLRLRWQQGLVAENVRFGEVREGLHPEVTASEVQVHLDYRALTRLKLVVDSLRLRRGSIIWPIPDPAQPNRQLSIQDIKTDLELLPGDQWRLDHFTAAFAGGRIQLSGAVTNASVVREWKFLQAERATPGGLWQNRLRSFADILEKIQFSSTPDLRLDVRGDARDLLSFQARLMLNTPGAQTPWGSVNDGKLVVHVFRENTNELSRADVNLEASDSHTEWASITNLHLTLQMVSLLAETNLVNCGVVASAAAVETKWAQATNAHFEAQWVHGFTNAVPMSGHGALTCGDLQTKWCSARDVNLKGNLGPRNGPPPDADASWGAWKGLAPYPLDFRLQARDFQRDGLEVTSLNCQGRWRGPILTLTNLNVELYGGNAAVNAELNAATRLLKAGVLSDVDPHKVESVLTPNARKFLSQFTWNTAPQLQSSVSLVLPPWTNASPDWRDVQQGLRIAGRFDLPKGGTFRGVPASQARSSFVYSNMAWRLPDLVAIRPEGKIEAEHSSSDAKKDYYWHLRSTIDPKVLRPLLGANERPGFDLFALTTPPNVEAEVWGDWIHPERIGFKGRAALANFSFRGERFDTLKTFFSYTNQILRFGEPEARRGAQLFEADAVTADFRQDKIFLTNGFSTGDPMVIARAIGPQVIRAIEPYKFFTPPTAYVHGVIPLARVEDADLYFRLAGGPFQWWNFRLPRIAGEVHWSGKRLSITDVVADFYGGKLSGSAGFEFPENRGPDYHFAALATNVVLEALMADLTTRSNHMEGALDVKLVVKRGNLSRRDDFDGYGAINLRDGLIWNIPIFGVFSAPLDHIVPGLGSTRAKEANGTFMITNGVIVSDDLEIRSPAMRLQYRGIVDMDERVNARVEAQVLRDMWLIGPIVSTVLWPFTKMFEYKVGGTLAEPRTELLYFGKPSTPQPGPELPRGAAPANPPASPNVPVKGP